MKDQKPNASVLLLLISAFAPPLAAILPNISFVRANVALTIVLTAGWESLLGVYVIWNDLVALWRPRITGSIDQWLSGIFARAGHQKQYFDHVHSACQDFDLRALRSGTTITLDEGFVEIYLKRPPHKISPNPVPGAHDAENAENTIWQYLTAPAYRKRHLLISVSAGRGKTTLLQHIALTLVTRGRKYRPLRSKMSPHTIPVFLPLKEIADKMSGRDPSYFTLEDVIQANLDKEKSYWPAADTGSAKANSEPLSTWLIRHLKDGHCLILLDGLDEVPGADKEMHEKMARWIEEQLKDYGANRFIVTSRPMGTSPDNLEELEIRSFDIAQIKKLIWKWCLALEHKNIGKKLHEISKDADDRAAGLLLQLRDNPNLLELAVNPLLLTMIVLAHKPGKALPASRAELFDEVFRVWFGERHEDQGKKLKLKSAQVVKLLQPLAYHMMEQYKETISLAEIEQQIAQEYERYPTTLPLIDFLQEVEKVSGLLLKQKQEYYKFAHQTFQEYLAARYIYEQRLEERLAQRIKQARLAGSQANLDWWKETILLYCSLGDGTEIVRECLDDQHPSEELYALAFDCLEMHGELEKGLIQTLGDLLNQGVIHTDPYIRRAMWGVTLRRRPRHMLRFNEETYIDRSLVTCAEYQLFLDDQRIRGKYCQPDHWHGDTFEEGLENAPVLGVRLSDARAFCEWLTARHGGQWMYRLPKAIERESILSLGTQLLPTTGFWVDDSPGFLWAGQIRELSEHFLHYRWEDDDGSPLLIEKLMKHACSRLIDDPRHARSNVLDLSRVLDQLREIDTELENQFYKVVDRPASLTSTIGPIEYRMVRQFVIKRLSQLDNVSSKRSNAFGRSSQKKLPQDIVDRVDLYIDAYRSLVIVEARRSKELYPYEGILLVRQGKPSIDQAATYY